ncbi:FliH/SctL family protein [Methylophilus methylotrophus]|uniref:FliH/SctL family protein n=1 Tax=Methylophilus methylotrophus TaxID=17 RepID=UPI0013DE115D|nr:FliH/SctL family protein [Methylophilus methylotrophus]
MPDIEEEATPEPVSVTTEVEIEEKQPAPTEKLLAEIEELKQLAYEKAYAEGLAAGKSEASKQAALEVQKSLTLIRKIEQEFEMHCNTYMAGMDQVISAIVFEAVLKIIGNDIQHTRHRAEILRQVIAQYDHRHLVQILVNPADIKAIKEAVQYADGVMSELDGLFYPDSSVSLAGCRMVFKDAIVNTDIKKQLQAFAEHLLEHAPLK